MPNVQHSTMSGDDLHTPFRQKFADEAARLAYVTTAADIDCMFLQQDNETLWRLKSREPNVWAQVGGGIDKYLQGAALNGSSLDLTMEDSSVISVDLSSLGGGGGGESAPASKYAQIPLEYAGHYDMTKGYTIGQIIMVTVNQVDNVTSVDWEGNLLLLTRDLPANTYSGSYPPSNMLEKYGVCLLPTGGVNPYIYVSSAAAVSPITDWKPDWIQDSYGVFKASEFLWQPKELKFPANKQGGGQYLSITHTIAYEYGSSLGMAVGPIRKLQDYSTTSEMPTMPLDNGLFLVETAGDWFDQGPMKLLANGSLSQPTTLTDAAQSFWSLVPSVRRDLCLMCSLPATVHMPWLTGSLANKDKLVENYATPSVGEIWCFNPANTSRKWIRPGGTGYDTSLKMAKYLGGGMFHISKEYINT